MYITFSEKRKYLYKKYFSAKFVDFVKIRYSENDVFCGSLLENEKISTYRKGY
jgi:hypothetical protein